MDNFILKIKRSDLDRAIEAEKHMEIVRITLDGKDYYAKIKFKRSNEIEMWIWQTCWGYSEYLIRDGFYSIVYSNASNLWLYYFNELCDRASTWNDNNTTYIIDEDK